MLDEASDETVSEQSAAGQWRAAVSRAREEPWEPEVWVEEPSGRDEEDDDDAGAAGPGGLPSRTNRRVPRGVAEELAKAVGAKRAAKLVERLADATRAYERDRYEDARRMLKPLAEQAPHVATVRELLGLTYYRIGRWADAARELEAAYALTASVDQHAVMADSYRAIGRHDRVEELWDELRQASPSGEAVAEGRIVAAGSRADQGDLTGAIRLLERSRSERRRPKEHHLRQWYALADLYERAGDIPRARELFNRVKAHGPQSFDVDERVRALR